MVADKRKKMQNMIDRLHKTCKKYGMEINVKKTKVMIMNKTEKQRSIMLDGVPLEQIKHFKYLRSWITDDAKSDKDIRTRVGMAKSAFWQNKELTRIFKTVIFNIKLWV